MTNFIEEMMQTAGVKPDFIYHYKLSNVKDEIAFVSTIILQKERIPSFHKFGYGKICKVVNCGFPTFTAEKQLELIKLISNKLGTPGIDIIFFDGTYNFYTGLRFGSSHQDFAQALAQLTTELMKVGELDKEKVKEVLNE